MAGSYQSEMEQLPNDWTIDEFSPFEEGSKGFLSRLQHECTNSFVLEYYSKSQVFFGELIRRACAANKSISPELLDLLSQDDDPTVREAVARNQACSQEIIAHLCSDNAENVRTALLERDILPPEWSSLFSWEITQKLEDELLDESVQKYYVAHSDAAVRAALARNKSVPIRVLEILRNDEDPVVQLEAFENLQDDVTVLRSNGFNFTGTIVEFQEHCSESEIEDGGKYLSFTLTLEGDSGWDEAMLRVRTDSQDLPEEALEGVDEYSDDQSLERAILASISDWMKENIADGELYDNDIFFTRSELFSRGVAENGSKYFSYINPFYASEFKTADLILGWETQWYKYGTIRGKLRLPKSQDTSLVIDFSKLILVELEQDDASPAGMGVSFYHAISSLALTNLKERIKSL